MQRLMKGKTKSCQTCGSFRTTPPCYNCTFNLDHPPPNYASLSRHDYCDDKVSPPGPTRLEHPLRGLPLMDLDPASSTAEYPMDETDFEVSRISQAVGRIGLAVAFLTDGRQTESATLPDSANNDTRSQNLSVPIQVPRSDEHTHFPRNCSAPELTSQVSLAKHIRAHRCVCVRIL